MFEISDVSIYLVNGNDSLKAFASIEICDSFVVKGLRIIEGSKGLFVAMPSNVGKDGNYYDNAFPITPDARNTVIDAVLKAYNKETSKNNKSRRK